MDTKTELELMLEVALYSIGYKEVFRKTREELKKDIELSKSISPLPINPKTGLDALLLYLSGHISLEQISLVTGEVSDILRRWGILRSGSCYIDYVKFTEGNEEGIAGHGVNGEDIGVFSITFDWNHNTLEVEVYDEHKPLHFDAARLNAFMEKYHTKRISQPLDYSLKKDLIDLLRPG